MRSRRLLLISLSMAGALLVSACSTSSSTRTASTVVPPAPKAGVHTVDWRNSTYSVACPGLGGPSDQQVPVTLTGGTGSTAPVTWFGTPIRLDVALVDVAYGDLTGDGQDEAVIRLSCTPEQSNGVSEEMQVFGPGRELLGTPALRNTTGSPFAPAIKTMTVADGAITGTALVWAAGDPHCCPSRTQPFRFSWDAERSAFDQS